MLAYDCGLTLPRDDRYASLRYKRVSGDLKWRTLDLQDARELAAIVAVVGFPAAKHAFGWTPWSRTLVEQLVDYLKDDPEVERMRRANLSNDDPDAAMALLSAMVDGGWKPKGKGWPGIIRVALLYLKERGFKAKDVAARYSLPLAIVRSGMLNRESGLRW